MKLTNTFSDLNSVREKMNAALSEWKPGMLENRDMTAIRIKLNTGIEITLDEISEYGGLFHHEGEQVVIYIKDHTRAHENRSPLNNINDRKKVHLKECQTIEQMKSDGRYDRYVVTNRRDNLYTIDLTGAQGTFSVDKSLYPCMHCLRELDIAGSANKGQRERKEIRNSFDVEQFFENYSTFFSSKPLYTDNNQPPNEYINGWDNVSRQVRSSNDWKCMKCQVDLSRSEEQKWLHVHHKNGIKGDNRPANLECLCAVCHGSEPGHGHMFVSDKARAVIARRLGK